MVGRINISRQADAVRHLFMALERDVRKIKTCWFCQSALPTMKFANKGHLKGNHLAECPFERLALAAEHCIKLRDGDDEAEKGGAETALAAEIAHLLGKMGEHTCPFQICQYDSGHRLECPFHAFERDVSGG
jgi:hypothetical protein